MPDPAIVVERVVEWSDTDASGHVHNGIAGRLLEAAESELMRRLDLAALIPHMPRVRTVAEFHARLYYGQTVRAELRLAEMGRTSLSWKLSVRGPDDVVAITAEAVVVHAPGPSAAPWPEAARAKLVAAGT
jgi:acyl-CoA thioesterase FadM